MSLTTLIKSIQDIMRKDVGVDGDAQRISQLVWMFFLKIYDDPPGALKLLKPMSQVGGNFAPSLTTPPR